MSRLAQYAASADAAQAPTVDLTDPARISAALAAHGIRFECHPLPANAATAEPEALLAEMADTVETLKGDFGYQSCDVVKVTSQTPNIIKARAGFLAEHIHGEDECRLMVAGGGTFYLHLGDVVVQVDMTAGDLISVPAGAKHWFDMGPTPTFTALRLFTNPEGWVADFTGDAIAQRFNLGDVVAA
jgi:1,2-dihydroxy-3-keto-5-methylthiopentene dioxygenase